MITTTSTALAGQHKGSFAGYLKKLRPAPASAIGALFARLGLHGGSLDGVNCWSCLMLELRAIEHDRGDVQALRKLWNDYSTGALPEPRHRASVAIRMTPAPVKPRPAYPALPWHPTPPKGSSTRIRRDGKPLPPPVR